MERHHSQHLPSAASSPPPLFPQHQAIDKRTLPQKPFVLLSDRRRSTICSDFRENVGSAFPHGYGEADQTFVALEDAERRLKDLHLKGHIEPHGIAEEPQLQIQTLAISAAKKLKDIRSAMASLLDGGEVDVHSSSSASMEAFSAFGRAVFKDITRGLEMTSAMGLPRTSMPLCRLGSMLRAGINDGVSALSLQGVNRLLPTTVPPITNRQWKTYGRYGRQYGVGCDPVRPTAKRVSKLPIQSVVDAIFFLDDPSRLTRLASGSVSKQDPLTKEFHTFAPAARACPIEREWQNYKMACSSVGSCRLSRDLFFYVSMCMTNSRIENQSALDLIPVRCGPENIASICSVVDQLCEYLLQAKSLGTTTSSSQPVSTQPRFASQKYTANYFQLFPLYSNEC
jgi:hypothetical protein